MRQICGTCKHHKGASMLEWYCAKKDSENYLKETEAHDKCDQWEQWSEQRSPQRT